MWCASSYEIQNVHMIVVDPCNRSWAHPMRSFQFLLCCWRRPSLLSCLSEPPSCSTAAAARLSFVHSHLDFKDLPARRSLLSHLVRKATVAVALLQLPLLPAGARSPPVQSDALPFGHLIWTLALHLALFCCCESLHLASEEASYVQGLISCGSGDDLSVSSLLPSPHRCWTAQFSSIYLSVTDRSFVGLRNMCGSVENSIGQNHTVHCRFVSAPWNSTSWVRSEASILNLISRWVPDWILFLQPANVNYAIEYFVWTSNFLGLN
jgi:hypothetical protein